MFSIFATQGKAQSETLFFFEQPDPNKATYKRHKKYVDDASLNSLGNKTSKQFPNVPMNDPTHPKTLAMRVTELTSMNSSRNLLDHTSEKVVPENNSSLSTSSTSSTYTDQRLQAVKFLTEDFLKELEDILAQFAESDMVPNLPGPVIFDLHSDWTDLTNNCSSNKQFPVWQTKKGKEDLAKKEKAEKSSELGSESGKKTVDGSSSKNMFQRRNSTSHSQKSNQAHGSIKLVRQPSKLGSITEDHHKPP